MPISDIAPEPTSNESIGLVVPHASNRIPPEAAMMYPSANFVPRGVGVRALTPEGYDPAHDATLPAAKALAKEGVAGIMLMGTSLTFYQGAAAHRRLLEEVRQATGLPTSSMSQAIVDGLKEVGGRRIAVATAYNDEVNDRLRDFLTDEEFEVVIVNGMGLSDLTAPERKTESEVIELAEATYGAAGEVDALLVACGGLPTLGIAQPLEDRHDIPVVSSTPAALRQAVRLVGQDGRLPGHGRLLNTI